MSYNPLDNATINEEILTAKQAEARLELADAIERLEANTDFQKVFNDFFFTKELQNIAIAAANASNASQEELAKCYKEQSLAIGLMMGFLKRIKDDAEEIRTAMREYDEAVEAGEINPDDFTHH